MRKLHRRYKTFKESACPPDHLEEVFHYHFINAHGTVIEIQQRIIQELKCRAPWSWMRLPTIGFPRFLWPKSFPCMLSSYSFIGWTLKVSFATFGQVVELIQSKFIPIVESIPFRAWYINSEDSFCRSSRHCHPDRRFSNGVLPSWTLGKWRFRSESIRNPTRSSTR